MPIQRAPDESSSLLPPGTLVDSWRVVEHHGQGSYGNTYRAVRLSQEEAGIAALKLARYPWDPRFAREGVLLSRLHHPSVPPLLDRGLWRPAPGVEYPYLVMEWIDGTPLYDWARQHAPSSQHTARQQSGWSPCKPLLGTRTIGLPRCCVPLCSPLRFGPTPPRQETS